MTDECDLADKAYAELVTSDTVTISKRHYEELLEDEKFLSALRTAGVDNWVGWDYAIDLLKEDE